MSWGFGKPAHFGLNKAPGMWMQGGGRSLLARAPDDVLGIDMSACDVFKDALDAAAKVACPTLIIAGDRDMMTPPKAAAPLAEAIPGRDDDRFEELWSHHDGRTPGRNPRCVDRRAVTGPARTLFKRGSPS